MKPRNMLIASAVAVTMLAAGCSSGGSGSGTTHLNLEKTNITVAAFPAIDSAGLYIAQDEGLFTAQGLHVTIQQFNSKLPPPSTQDLINGQVKGHYDITAGDYVTYIENQLGAGLPQLDLRLVAEASFLQPNVLTLMVNGGFGDQPGQPAQGQERLGQRAERHRHLADRLAARVARPHTPADPLHHRAVPGRGRRPDRQEEPAGRGVRA